MANLNVKSFAVPGLDAPEPGPSAGRRAGEVPPWGAGGAPAQGAPGRSIGPGSSLPNPLIFPLPIHLGVVAIKYLLFLSHFAFQVHTFLFLSIFFGPDSS